MKITSWFELYELLFWRADLVIDLTNGNDFSPKATEYWANDVKYHWRVAGEHRIKNWII